MINKINKTKEICQQPIKKWYSFSNISTAILFILILAMFFSPEVKGAVMQGLMRVGFFQPDIPAYNDKHTVLNSDVAENVVFAGQNGKQLNLKDLKGKVVFMNFWATWCPPCIAEMPSINQLYLKYKDHKNVVFVMVDVDGRLKESVAFMKNRRYTLPVYIAASEIPHTYFAGSMPTTVILDKNGQMAFHHVGGADYSHPKMIEFIDKLSK